jgi:DNA-binding winged helix-turn-helix (wHTH) protein
MEPSSLKSPRTAFDRFEVDLRSGELRKDGRRVRMQAQPFQLLALLLEHPGEVVTREEICRKLWDADTFVDFDHSLGTAINKIREALGDSADHPRFVETLPRRGYRFIGTTNHPPAVSEIVPEIISNVSRESEHSTSEFPATRQTKVRTSSRTRWMKISASILVGVACATGLMFSYYRIFPRVNFVPEAPVPFTDYPGFEYCPTFSPNGSQIAFAWTGDPAAGSKGADLYVKAIHSENLLRLTQHQSESICSAWSPDSTQIAFHRLSGADTGIYLVPALGGAERKLRSTQVGGGISWSADGKWLAYPDLTRPAGVIHPTDPTRLYVLSLETLESRQIPHAEECLAERQPVFSHSGDRLAYGCLLKINDNEFGIYFVSLSGGPPKMVAKFTTGWSFLQGIAWTADDKRLIVSRPHVGRDFELDEVVLADGTLRKLPFGQGSCCPAISTKGDRLAYSVYTIHTDIWRKDLRHTEAAGAKLISSTYEQDAPQYSPDGKHIAFTSNRGGANEIWMSDGDGTNLVRMSDGKSSIAGSSRWSPR